MALTSRLARREDVPALLPLIAAAIDELQKGFLDDAQIKSSRSIMGIDTQLIDDGTLRVSNNRLCWSGRMSVLVEDAA